MKSTTTTTRKKVSSILALILCAAMTVSVAYPAGLGDMSSSGDTNAAAGPGGDSNGDSNSGSSSITVESSGDYYVVTGVLGSFSSSDDNDHIYTTTAYYDGTTLYTTDSSITESSASGTTITDSSSGHSAIVLKDAGNYTISGVTLSMITDADGSDTCDFTGVGAAIAVFGDSNVTIENSTITSTGVATMPIFVDDGATVTIKSSKLVSNGGTLYSSYTNTYEQSVMVAPPWVLGIMGTSRTTNLMGTDSVMNIMDSETYAGAWAVLSTDSGSDMILNVYNTTLTLMNADEGTSTAIQADGGQITTADNPYTVNYGSGYGTYAIGDAVETFAGATLNVGTYATIFTGGSATYTSLVAGTTYTLSDGVTYTATEDKVTTINSDTFGFMIHQDSNTIVIEAGTVVNSGYATFLVKSGSSDEEVTATIDNAVISNGGVLIQVMDNDDATTGTTTSGFATTHTESSGFDTSSASSDGSVQSFTFTNGTYTGNIYNASGSDGLDATTLNVTLGTGAVLIGAAASTAAIHVTYDGSQVVKANGGDAYESSNSSEILSYQNTSFTISEYWSIGQVANLVNSNGGNDINMTLTGGAAWYVDGTSLITSLTMDSSSTVYIAEGASLTIGSTTYSTEGTLTYENGSLTFTAGEVTIPDTSTDGDDDEDAACEHTSTSVVNAQEATCTEDGYTGDTVCDICGETIAYGETIPATGHSYDDGTVTTEPTCTEAGVMTYTCTVCGDTYTETIAATGHSYELTSTVENDDGSITYTYTCSVCGDTYTEVEEAEKELSVPSVTLTLRQNGSKIQMVATMTGYDDTENYYAITGHGFVYITKSLLGSRTLTLSTNLRTKVTVNGEYSSSDGYKYAYSMTPTSKTKQYVFRAWISYTDGDGTTQYVYSDTITATYNSLS